LVSSNNGVDFGKAAVILGLALLFSDSYCVAGKYAVSEKKSANPQTFLDKIGDSYLLPSFLNCEICGSLVIFPGLYARLAPALLPFSQFRVPSWDAVCPVTFSLSQASQTRRFSMWWGITAGNGSPSGTCHRNET
jgi:hypothetical protein